MLAELLGRLEDIILCLRNIRCRELLEGIPCPEEINDVITEIEVLVGGES